MEAITLVGEEIMALVHYTAEVKSGLLLELPSEAEELHLSPGDKVEVRLKSLNNQKTDRPIEAPRRVSALGKYAGVLSSEAFMRHKQEEIDREDRPRS